jgi:hypothetical protein
MIENAARHVVPAGAAGRIQDLLRPINRLAGLIPLSETIEAALHANIWLADQWANQRSILRGLGAESFDELKNYKLEDLDRSASHVHGRGIVHGGAMGAGAGAGGLFLAIPGAAAVINISLRTIRRIGLCYGYSDLDDLEKRFILGVLGLSGASSQAKKLASAKMLTEIQVMVANKTFKSMAQKAMRDKMSKEALVMTAKTVAKDLGVQLTKKRILIAVPAIGGGVGLLVDGNYLRRVGGDAVKSYQRRWLMDQGRWPRQAGE